MELSQKEVWQQNLSALKFAPVFCLIVALMFLCFVSLADALWEGAGIVTLFRNGHNLILALACGMAFTACFMAYHFLRSGAKKRFGIATALSLAGVILFTGVHFLGDFQTPAMTAVMLAAFAIAMVFLALAIQIHVQSVKRMLSN